MFFSHHMLPTVKTSILGPDAGLSPASARRLSRLFAAPLLDS